ncbi:hypothetical protein HS7_01600 [Sulfolobales archaeon HS-7]|nr:hypothetical protein HS7_01600 [Sulfolobales archaeon HS-7]
MSSVVEIYNKTVQTLSKQQYLPAIMLLQALFLTSIYAAGMGIDIYYLPLVGAAITAHIYSAIGIAVLALLGLGAGLKSNSLLLKILMIMNAVSVVAAAFFGLIYFGGESYPIFAYGMGLGYIFVLFTCIGGLFYALRK